MDHDLPELPERGEDAVSQGGEEMSVFVNIGWAIVGSSLSYILYKMVDLPLDVLFALIAIILAVCICDAFDTLIEEQKEKAQNAVDLTEGSDAG
ncbi:MAG: hypothetical protein EHJ95_04860 [Methanobacteriota archaeon]|nr:MAG: hypothetical protein EHJ95_04860 [Euryarchaeota archaeon]